MKEHRKLTAIMFTDIAGYTELMSKDEQKALQILQKNREVQKPLIKKHEGEWLKEMGDGTLSSFTSAVKAVNCALEIQHSLKDEGDFKLRIGIHIGDVVISKSDIFGSGVNIASRIEPLAESGGICISERVYDDILNKPGIETAFIGEKKLKNVSRPIKVYALSGHGLPVPVLDKPLEDYTESRKSAKDSMIGKTISHYHIIDKIGEGGMGIVFKAEDIRLKRLVALKFLKPEILGNEAQKNRFIKEAQSGAILNHQNICTVYEIDRFEDNIYIAMEYIEGHSLKEKVAWGPMKVKIAIDVVLQVAEGLYAAHERGIIHRDIKSANIMVEDKTSRSGLKAKIMDFGLAKTAYGSIVTKEGTTLGTVNYMSPEQAKGENVDARTDIFSLGVMLYEIITGELPFKGDNDQAVMYNILNTEPEPLTAKRTGIPIELDSIVAKMLAKDPAKRYQNIEEIPVDLESVNVKSTGTTSIASTASVSIDGEKVIFSMPQNLLKKLLSAAAAAVILIGSYYLYNIVSKEDSVNSLAILPFTYTGSQEELEILSEGIPDNIVTSLLKLPDLRVTPFSSVLYRYGKEAQDPIEVGRELKVSVIVTGRIVPRGDAVAITIEIIDTKEGIVRFAPQYEDRLSNLANIPTRIAQNIAELLSVKVSGEEAQEAFEIVSIDPDAARNYMIGRSFLRKRTPNDLTKAIEYLERAIDIYPEYAEAYTGIADAYILQGDYAGVPDYLLMPRAREAAEKALKLNDNLAEAHTSMGGVLQKEGKFPQSRNELERAIEINPGYVLAYHWLGNTFASMGDRENAIDIQLQALELDPMNPVVNNNVAHLFHITGQIEKAREQSSKNVELNPESAHAQIGYGLLLSLLNEHKEAVKQAEKALALDSLTIHTAESAVRIYQRAGQLDIAYEEGKRLIELYPQSPETFGTLATVIRASGGNQKVIEEFEKIVKDYPQSSGAFLVLGNTYRITGEFDTAVKYYRAAIRLSPKWYEAYTVLGVTYQNAGENDKAAEQFRLAINNSALSGTYLLLASMYLSDYEFSRAIETFEEADRRFPGTIAVSRDFSRTLLVVGDYDSAIEHSKRVFEQDNSTFNSNNLMGLAYHYARDYDNAIEYFKKSVEIFPNSQTGNKNLADAYLANGQHEDAAAIYQKTYKKRLIPSIDEVFENSFGGGEFNRSSLQFYLGSIIRESDKTFFKLSPRIKAHYYAYMNEQDSSMVMLDNAFAEKDKDLPLSMSNFFFDNVRLDPRFQELLKEMNLDEYEIFRK